MSEGSYCRRCARRPSGSKSSGRPEEQAAVPPAAPSTRPPAQTGSTGKNSKLPFFTQPNDPAGLSPAARMQEQEPELPSILNDQKSGQKVWNDGFQALDTRQPWHVNPGRKQTTKAGPQLPSSLPGRTPGCGTRTGSQEPRGFPG